MRTSQLIADLAPENELMEGGSLIVVIVVIVVVAVGLVGFAMRRARRS